MLKHFLIFILASLSSASGRWPFASLAYAFDPTTIAMGADAASAIMGGMDKVDEAASVGFALGDLLAELGLENDSEEELKKSVSELEDLNSKVKDLKWAKDDFKEALEFDLKRGQSLTSKIKALQTLISASKKIAVIAGLRPKAAESAVRIQEIKINSMILEELQAMRRTQYLAYLEDQKYKVNREIMLNEIVEQERGRSYGLNRKKIQ